MPDSKLALYIAGLALLCLGACSAPQTQSESDITLFINGDILTMNEKAPAAQALAVQEGKILAVGRESDVRDAAGKNPQIYNLSGQTLMPGFIDAHGHIAGGAFTTALPNLQPPPAGGVSNFDDLKSTLKAWSEQNPDAPWIFGFGYDDSLMTEGRHPTKADLDLVSTEQPIIAMHVSGHLAACNTPCLAAAGINAQTANPPGGIIRRMPGSNEPDGVLEETARWLPITKMPRPTAEQTVQAMIAQQSYFAGYGITTAQEGNTDLNTVSMLEGMAAADQLMIDIVAYPSVKTPADFTTQISPSQDYNNGFRVGGIKLTLDGSPQGKTAWMTMPYHVVPEGSPDDYAGYPIFKAKDVETIVKQAFERGAQVISHANGDAAADQLLAGIKRANDALGIADRRPVMIHAQTVRDDQIDMMKAQGVIPSYFVSHTFFWGDWHRDSVLGEQRAARISPLNTSLSKNVPFTIHNDTPVVPPDMMRLVWTAVMRETRSGQTLGETERVSPHEALKAITINAAYQYFEEDSKGSLEIGKLADLVVLSDNPTTISAGDIKDIEIIETFKEGRSIFRAP